MPALQPGVVVTAKAVAAVLLAAIAIVGAAAVRNAIGAGTSSYTNPTTQVGDLVVGIADGGVERLGAAGASDAAVLTLLNGSPAWRTLSFSGSGTYAARPASPSLGDTYTVTSGTRTGSVYRSDSSGAWTLVSVLPLLPVATAQELFAFDAEFLTDAVGQSLASWPEARGRVLLTQANVAVPTGQITATAASWGALPYAQFPSSGTGVVLGAPATAGPSGAAARTFAVLVSSVPTWVAAGGLPQNVGGWGIAGGNAAWTIRASASAANVTGLSLYGTDPVGSGAYPSSSTPTLLYAVYTGTRYALYQTPVDAASESTSVALTALAINTTSGALPGGISAVFGFVLGAHSYSRNVEFYRGRLHGAWIYDRALDASAREALRAALATRYGS